ncbi:MAG: Methyltransferase type 11, partial [Solirubrobacterales bacterium]|nr:Methyltransferase type 11 [Solirubrobacterales bacterium]
APLWRSALRVAPAPGAARGGPPDDHALEPLVDVHAFTPDELADHSRRAGFVQVRVRGEELLANWFGWANRTLEASADPATIPWLWTQYAYRGYLLLQRVDEQLLESRLPPAVFYNLMVAGMKD